MSTPPHDELALRAQQVPEQAKALEVTDQASYDEGGRLLLAISALIKEADDLFREPKQKTDEAHKSVCAAHAKIREPLSNARDFLKQKLTGYLQAELDRAEIVNRLARDQAHRRHCEDIEAQVEEAERAGATLPELAAIMDQVALPPLPITKPVTTIKGISSREVWTGQITDKVAFIEAALKDPKLLAVVEINRTKLDGLVRYLKRALNGVPGLLISHKPGLTATPKRGGYL
jgi:hypothetical protein